MAFESVNSKVVRVRVAPGRPVLARRGAMLGYTGHVSFRPVSGPGGVTGVIGRALSGESAAMMLAEGDGEVLYGFGGLHCTVVDLDGSQPLSVESDRLLAHDTSLQTSVVPLSADGGLRGLVRGAATGQGLFTTRVSGAGSLAVVSHGGTVTLPVRPGADIGVDPQAYVAHRGAVTVQVSTLGAGGLLRDAVGRGTGESVQLRLSGSGDVLVQASEKKL